MQPWYESRSTRRETSLPRGRPSVFLLVFRVIYTGGQKLCREYETKVGRTLKTSRDRGTRQEMVVVEKKSDFPIEQSISPQKKLCQIVM